MSEFKYPDENDRLTNELITREYDGAYWEGSEELVLSRAEEFLLETYGRDALSKMDLLDLGCGTGRLIPRFAALFHSVVGIEPDSGRCAQAGQLIREKGIGNAQVLNTDSGQYLKDNPSRRFGAILCSHVFQHISHDITIGILRDMEDLASDDAAFIITTTFVSGDDNEYSTESFTDGSRVSRITDYRGFMEAMGKQGTLPVCRFSRGWMEKLLKGFGLCPEYFRAFHFEGEHDPASDEGNNLDPEKLGKARDAAYFCRRSLEAGSAGDGRISGKVCYMQFYSYDGNKTDLSPFLSITEDEAAKALRADFDTVEGFLYGAGLHFPCERRFIPDLGLSLEGVPIASSHAVMTVYKEVNVCQISVCLKVEDTTAENFIYLHHIQCSPAENFASGGRRLSIPGACETLLKRYGFYSPALGETGYVLEVNRFGDRIHALGLSENEMKCFYGMLTGDEGYVHVPVQLARDRMDQSWSSRDFVKAVVFNNSYLLINLNRDDTFRDYLARQYGFQYHYYSGINDYFTMDASTAGVNHGLFFSIETGLIVKTATDRMLEDRPDLDKPQGLILSDEIKDNKKRRIAMIKMLNRVETVSISELGELDTLVLRQLNTSERVESIRNLLELLESDLDLLYSTTTNRMVTFLTILGLLFALIQVIVGIIPLF
ncbi:MAG: class I SAM-dependent methyltransferase [Eubacteriales bacterium]|nr:class I SAM-dependent methyltransferase [Eubacteriales bacterium]